MLDKVVARFVSEHRGPRNKICAVYFFGSRARGKAREDSDYDLLFVVKNNFSNPEKEVFYDTVMDILLDTGKLVSLKFLREEEFQKLHRLNTPFIANILREGIKLG